MKENLHWDLQYLSNSYGTTVIVHLFSGNMYMTGAGAGAKIRQDKGEAGAENK